jgi:hypothetical protein
MWLGSIRRFFIGFSILGYMVEMTFSSGDYVRFRLALEEIEGRILESSDNSIVLLKLNSGYNCNLVYPFP